MKVAHSSLTALLMLAVSPAMACGCSIFDPIAETVSPSANILSQDARVIRDFSLFAHRKIADDIIQNRGLYLETVLNYFSTCGDRTKKLVWLRHVLISAPETDVFADRIAQMYESSKACGLADPASLPADTETPQ